ncbi:hypothetical protein L1987_13219 [Smallanthus sonchifolius]|uniref:Uncharacterized protein n=1 Tax=Smallanthus sonchifolius TaxID=185202 RepID=A0ACB9JHH3_9ASTR|nr:hypothetical protein L1987_13219 [Smallanthus sonchifolius]
MGILRFVSIVGVLLQPERQQVAPCTPAAKTLTLRIGHLCDPSCCRSSSSPPAAAGTKCCCGGLTSLIFIVHPSTPVLEGSD